MRWKGHGKRGAGRLRGQGSSQDTLRFPGADFRVRYSGTQIHRLGNALGRGGMCDRAAQSLAEQEMREVFPGWQGPHHSTQGGPATHFKAFCQKAPGKLSLWVVGHEKPSSSFLECGQSPRVSRRCF